MNTAHYLGLGLVNLGVVCFAYASYLDSGLPLLLFVIGVWFVVFGFAIVDEGSDIEEAV